MSDTIRERLEMVARSLIDQEAARTIVEPQSYESGYWFGGGNMIESNGSLYLTGRYRNAGDSRTGLKKGERGLELAIFRSSDGGKSFEKVKSFSKSDLDVGEATVLSIEGTSLAIHGDSIELYVSTEKDGIGYPDDLAEFQKPGTGVWSIDCIRANSVESLESADIKPILATTDPRVLHIKDPVLHTNSMGDTVLFFCTHPFGWTSSNSGYAIRPGGADTFGAPVFEFFPRGFTWDVAATRLTDVLTMPESVTGGEAHNLVFYDGAECIRAHDENARGVKRPRGYSCEELGSAAFYRGDRIEEIERLGVLGPMFVSPWGTGCSRYVHTLATEAGVFATWQQSKPSGAQPLVMNFRSWEDLAAVTINETIQLPRNSVQRQTQPHPFRPEPSRTQLE